MQPQICLSTKWVKSGLEVLNLRLPSQFSDESATLHDHPHQVLPLTLVILPISTQCLSPLPLGCSNLPLDQTLHVYHHSAPIPFIFARTLKFSSPFLARTLKFSPSSTSWSTCSPMIFFMSLTFHLHRLCNFFSRLSIFPHLVNLTHLHPSGMNSFFCIIFIARLLQVW